ncbi:MAG: acetoin utilization protein AcuC [candidate division NC10 bacterium]|jgi:acetoin utilization protein AcuC|nr:acetoin utilization protein AcuC [candidate division NC10 bacterium]
MATLTQAVYLYTPKYQEFDYGSSHPMKIRRLKLTHDLAQAYGLFHPTHVRLADAPAAAEEDILRIHTQDYLDVLREAGEGLVPPHSWRFGLGAGDNPIFPGLYTYSALLTGASLEAARLVASGKTSRAFNIAGGLHHAASSRASGFCYINDAAVAISFLTKTGLRVAYVDIDAHHGDGVQNAFYDTDQVLTISLHETGLTLFPGTGFPEEIGTGKGEGYSVNVPLAPETDDEIFVWAFEETVLPLLEAFRPDVVVTQLGIDAHRSDPLSNLRLTMQGFLRAVMLLKESAPRWLALGGGGYYLGNVPRAWTAVWALMAGIEIDPELPPVFLSEFRAEGCTETALTDPPYKTEGAKKEEAWHYARTQVKRVHALVFPRLGIRG